MNHDNKLYELSLKATRLIGTPKSILIHTIFFIGIFILTLFNVSFSDVLLILTTIVSLEAIYLAIFIQMTVNINTARLHSVSKDVEEIQEDVGEISESVEDLQGNVEDLQENVEEIQEDVEEIQEDVGEISESVEENLEEKPKEKKRRRKTPVKKA